MFMKILTVFVFLCCITCDFFIYRRLQSEMTPLLFKVKEYNNYKPLFITLRSIQFNGHELDGSVLFFDSCNFTLPTMIEKYDGIPELIKENELKLNWFHYIPKVDELYPVLYKPPHDCVSIYKVIIERNEYYELNDYYKRFFRLSLMFTVLSFYIMLLELVGLTNYRKNIIEKLKLS